MPCEDECDYRTCTKKKFVRHTPFRNEPCGVTVKHTTKKAFLKVVSPPPKAKNAPYWLGSTTSNQ